jgi:hypothetical protein
MKMHKKGRKKIQERKVWGRGGGRNKGKGFGEGRNMENLASN